jgi:hypothetical protein
MAHQVVQHHGLCPRERQPRQLGAQPIDGAPLRRATLHPLHAQHGRRLEPDHTTPLARAQRAERDLGSDGAGPRVQVAGLRVASPRDGEDHALEAVLHQLIVPSITPLEHGEQRGLDIGQQAAIERAGDALITLGDALEQLRIAVAGLGRGQPAREQTQLRPRAWG